MILDKKQTFQIRIFCEFRRFYKYISCKKIILDKLIIVKNMIVINSYQIQMNEN